MMYALQLQGVFMSKAILAIDELEQMCAVLQQNLADNGYSAPEYAKAYATTVLALIELSRLADEYEKEAKS